MTAREEDDVRSSAIRALLAGVSALPAGVELEFPAGDPVHPRVLVALDAASSTAVRDAALAALTALGYAEFDLAFAAFVGDVDTSQLRIPIETLDPEVIVTLSEATYRVIVEALAAGESPCDGVIRAGGRRIVAIGDFASVLEDERTKRAAWGRFKLAGVRRPAY